MTRYTVKSLKLSDADALVNGSYVCEVCRNLFRRKPAKAVPYCQEQPEQPDPLECPALEDHLYAQSSVEVHEQNAVIGSDHNYYGTSVPSLHSSSDQSCSSKRQSVQDPDWNPKRVRTQTRAQNGHSRRTSFKKSMIDLLQRSQYERALNVMYGSTNRAVKKAVQNFVGNVVKKEIRQVLKSTQKKYAFAQAVSQDTLSSFQWCEAIEEVKHDMPITVTTLQNLFPDSKHISKVTTVGRRGSKR